MSRAAIERVVGNTPQTGADEDISPDDVLRRLIVRTRASDPSAIPILVGKVAPRLVRTIRQVLGSAHPDVEDVAQDAIVSFIRALAEFRGESTVMHFAHRIATLTALAARRRNGIRERRMVDEPLDDLTNPAPQSSPHVDLLASRRRHLVRELLDDLPAPIAESMALHFVLGFTVDEIAATAKVPANTVWSRLRLGKAAMRKRLQRDRQFAELMQVFE